MYKLKLLFLSMGMILLFFVSGCYSTPTKNDTSHKTQKTHSPKVSISSDSVEYMVLPKDGLRIYTDEKQQKVKSKIQAKRKSKKYTFHYPLIYYNPYGTNLRSANIYFSTKQPCQAFYTVSTNIDPNHSFQQWLNNDKKNNMTTNHAYQLIGLVPDAKNTIQIDLYNKNGKKIATKTFWIQVPAINSIAQNQLTKTTIQNAIQTNGLFTVMYGRSKGKLQNICLYDNDGFLRSEFPVEGYRTDRLLFIKKHLYYSVGYDKIVKVNRLGEVKQIYTLGDYTMHHDFIYDKHSNALLILASKNNSPTVEDFVLKLDLKTGTVSELLDLKKILPKEYRRAKKGKNKKTLDWAHINTIQVGNKGELILSLRELSSIVKIKNVYKTPRLDYILCDRNIWKDSAYLEYVYHKIGDFTAHSGQHTVTYHKGKTKDIYRLSMFHNNLTYSSTRPDIDWSGYKDSQIPEKERFSYYYEYEINEKEKNFKLIKSFPVLYSGYVSSTQKINDHYIICSGSQKVFGEYDTNGKLLTEYQVSGDRHLYRTFKYSFQNFWFSK